MSWRPPLMALLAATLLSGCGDRKATQDRVDGGSPRGDSTNRQHDSSAPTVNAKDSVPTTPEPSPRGTRTASAKRTWDNFPIDAIFFEDPGAQLEEGSRVAASGNPPSPSAPVATDVAPTSPANAADLAAQTNWSELLSDEDLIAEVKEIRNRLEESMGRLETYNGRYREVRVDAAVLAVLAGIAARADFDVPWKRQAVHLRDVAGQLARSANGLGPANYDPAQESFAKLEPLFGGRAGKVDGLDPNPIVDMPWINVADLGRLMQRMNVALEIRIKEAAVDATELRRNVQLVRHEAAVLATLAAVISTSYDGSEDEEYQEYANRLKQEALGLREAAAKGDVDTASQRIAAVRRSCTDCHDDYRFGDDF